MGFSDIDSLTELSSDEEYTKASGSKKEKKPWKLKQVLKMPKQSTYSVASIYGKYDFTYIYMPVS